MRIAVLTNSFPPQRGGAAAIASIQVELLRAYGHEVRVWCPSVSWFASTSIIRFFRHLLDVFSREKILQEIHQWKPDVLLTHNLTGCGFGTPRVLQQSGVKWMHVLHDVQLFEPSGRLRHPAITQWQQFWSWLRRRYFGQPDLVISPTRWLIEEHQRRGFFQHAHVEILPNPSPSAAFVLRMPQEPMQLLLIGATQEKGFDFAVSLVNRLPFDVVLHVVGASIPRVEGKIKMHGGKDPQGILELMKTVDALLVPSTIAENQPTVILEAASVGLPVVAADIGGIAETLGGCGLLCPQGDMQAWVDALTYLREAQSYSLQASSMYELARRHDPVAYGSMFHQLILNR